MTTLRVIYQRRMLQGLLWALPMFAVIAILCVTLSPVDTLSDQLIVGMATVLFGTVGVIAVRRFRVLPCPHCRVELRAALVAALRGKRRSLNCPNCGKTLQV